MNSDLYYRMGLFQIEKHFFVVVEISHARMSRITNLDIQDNLRQEHTELFNFSFCLFSGFILGPLCVAQPSLIQHILYFKSIYSKNSWKTNKQTKICSIQIMSIK